MSTTVTMYLDFISPYAYLAFETLPPQLAGLDVTVRYEPILFAGLLKHHGQLGPAEIASKREWTYRQVLWLAREAQVPLAMPARHPFNPLALLRLARACTVEGEVDRVTCATLFQHVWCHEGQEAEDVARLEALIQKLQPMRAITDAQVKQSLIDATAPEHRAFGDRVLHLEARAEDDGVDLVLDAASVDHSVFGDRDEPTVDQAHVRAVKGAQPVVGQKHALATDREIGSQFPAQLRIFHLSAQMKARGRLEGRQHPRRVRHRGTE